MSALRGKPSAGNVGNRAALKRPGYLLKRRIKTSDLREGMYLRPDSRMVKRVHQDSHMIVHWVTIEGKAPEMYPGHLWWTVWEYVIQEMP